MELYQLRTFATVADTGHLTRAAERLHLSQPAVSAHIKALEEELGVRLFDRGPAGMALTRSGGVLQAQAAKVIAASEELRRLAKSLQGEITGRLRIGTLSDPNVIRVGEFLADTVQRYPLLELELQAEVSGAALEAVREGALDASFYFGDPPGAGISGIRLRELVYRVVTPADWAPRLQDAEWGELASEQWIIPPSISTLNPLLNGLFEQHGAAPQKLVSADQESVISNLVMAGVGASLMLEEMALAREAEGALCVWGPAKMTTSLWFVYPSERAGDPALAALLELIRELWDIDDAPAPAASASGGTTASGGATASGGNSANGGARAPVRLPA